MVSNVSQTLQKAFEDLSEDRLKQLILSDKEFSHHLKRLFELILQSTHGIYPDSEEEQKVLLEVLASTLTPLKQVGAIGYQRDARGTLLVCVLVNSRELEPEREVIEELIKVRSGNPTVWFDFTTLLSPPSLPEDMIASGFESLPVKSEAKD